jgi:hypothetical protein
MTTLQTVTAEQVNKETPFAENFDSLSAAAIYAKRHPVTAGLVWGFYGGLYNGNTIADGTVTLTDAATNYVVVLRSTGVVSTSTSSANSVNPLYAKLYTLTTAGSVVTAEVDSRWDANGLFFSSGGGGGAVATDVIWDAAGDLAVGSGSNTAVRLARGSALQVLRVNAGGTDLEYATPSSGGAIATDVIWDAVGDLAVGSGANTAVRLARGSALQVLRVNAGGTDLEYATPTAGSTIGQHMLPVMASAMTPRSTGGCGTLVIDGGASDQPDIPYLPFDAATQEGADFSVAMPESWNEGTITFKPIWKHQATTVNFGVVWRLRAIAFSDDDAMASNFGTGQTSTDTGGTTRDHYIGPTSAAITIAGSPAAGDTVYFNIERIVSDGADTMAVDAELLGVRIYYTTAAETD